MSWEWGENAFPKYGLASGLKPSLRVTRWVYFPLVEFLDLPWYLSLSRGDGMLTQKNLIRMKEKTRITR